MKKFARILSLFLVGVVVATLVMTFQTYRIYSNKIKVDIKILREAVANNFISASVDLELLTRTDEIKNLATTDIKENRDATATLFAEFIKKNPGYSQLRFLTETGNEIVRVDQKTTGEVSISPPSNLQNKATRYYFSDTMKLMPGELYVSPLDLNIEHSKIVYPYEPTIRLATPIADDSGEKVGMLILNFNVAGVLDQLKAVDESDTSYHIYFSNSDGDWFRAPNPEDDWAFMFPDGNVSRVRDQFPILWADVLKTDEDNLLTPMGYFHFEKIKPIELVQQNQDAGGRFTYFSRYLSIRDFYMVVIIRIAREDIPQLFLDNVIIANVFYILVAGALVSLGGMTLQKRR